MGKYEEALERANEAVKRGMVSQNFVDGIFGVESEDERMMKAILATLRQGLNTEIVLSKYGLTYDDVEAWLEKKKEQNVVPSRETILGVWELGNFWKGRPEERDGLTQLQYIQKHWFEKCDYQKEQKPECQDTDVVLPNGNWTELDERRRRLGLPPIDYDALASEQKEPKHEPEDLQKSFEMGQQSIINNPEKYGLCKPAECLKAERDGWYVCIKDYHRGGRKRSSVGDLVQAKGGMHIMGEKDISEWFRRAYYEEVRDAFEPNADTNKPEKPAEWSEEDEEILNRLIEDYEYAVKSSGGIGDVRGRRFQQNIDWLKSLRTYSKIEWTEEDDEKRNRAISYLSDWIQDHIIDKEGIKDVEAIKSWLSELAGRPCDSCWRPSWKPSDEQMEAL